MPNDFDREVASATKRKSVAVSPLRKITSDQIDSKFMEELSKMPDADKIHACFQCGVCTGSCPITFAMDYTPRQISEMIHVGLKDAVLSSAAIWLCSTCYMCYERCPQGVKLTDVFNAIKNKAVDDGYAVPPVYEKMSRQLLKNGFVYDVQFMNDDREALGLPKVEDVKPEIIAMELKDTLICTLLGERKATKKDDGEES
jgi:heterodisulfide reductase subunit C